MTNTAMTTAANATVWIHPIDATLDREASLKERQRIHRMLLNARFGSERPVSIARGEKNEPYLVRDGLEMELFVSLSYSNAMLAMAIGNCPIGIDLEQRFRAADQLRISKRYFSKEEYSALLETENPEQQDELFLELWTVKEALGKLCKTGISPTSLGVSTVLKSGRVQANKEWLSRNVQVQHYQGQRHALSVAMELSADTHSQVQLKHQGVEGWLLK